MVVEYLLILGKYSFTKLKLKAMKPYACYPRTRAVYGRPFINPFFPGFPYESTKGSAVTERPLANIQREENAYKILLALPGVTKEQIKIEFKDDQLIVTGSASGDAEAPKFVRKEFDYAGFRRTFRLHKDADTTAMTASFDQGILSITIPDKTPVTTKIEIR